MYQDVYQKHLVLVDNHKDVEVWGIYMDKNGRQGKLNLGTDCMYSLGNTPDAFQDTCKSKDKDNGCGFACSPKQNWRAS